MYAFDGSSKLQDLDKHTFLGEATFVLSGIMCAPGQVLIQDLTSGKETYGLRTVFNPDLEAMQSMSLYCCYRGKIEVRGEATHHTRDNFVVTFSANKLSNKEGFFSTSSPLLKISRCV